MFAGKRAISKAFAAEGLRSCSLDYEHDARDAPWQHARKIELEARGYNKQYILSTSLLAHAQDILSPQGFVRFLWAAMNLAAGGLCVAGVKCSTWSIVNRT